MATSDLLSASRENGFCKFVPVLSPTSRNLSEWLDHDIPGSSHDSKLLSSEGHVWLRRELGLRNFIQEGSEPSSRKKVPHQDQHKLHAKSSFFAKEREHPRNSERTRDRKNERPRERSRESPRARRRESGKARSEQQWRRNTSSWGRQTAWWRRRYRLSEFPIRLLVTFDHVSTLRVHYFPPSFAFCIKISKTRAYSAHRALRKRVPCAKEELCLQDDRSNARYLGRYKNAILPSLTFMLQRVARRRNTWIRLMQ